MFKEVIDPFNRSSLSPVRQTTYEQSLSILGNAAIDRLPEHKVSFVASKVGIK